MTSLILNLLGIAILILGVSAFVKFKYLQIAANYWDRKKTKNGDSISSLTKKITGIVYIILGILIIVMSVAVYLGQLRDQEKEAHIKSEASRLGISIEDYRTIDSAFLLMPKGSTVEDYKIVDDRAKKLGFKDGYDYLLEEYRAKKDGKKIEDIIAQKQEKEVAYKNNALMKDKPSSTEAAKDETGASADSGEVGNLLFVVEPKASPILVSRSGTKYWSCNGFINKKLIKIVHEEMKMLSESSGVPLPSKELCLYNISSIDMGFGPITMYGLDMYTSQNSMDRCLNENYCDNFRTMTFKVVNEKLHRQYLITNIEKSLTKMSCISMEGKVVSSDGGCS